MYNYQLLSRLANEFGTSYYIFNENLLIDNVSQFSSALKKYYDNTIVSYAYKANYMPIIGRILNEIGC